MPDLYYYHSVRRKEENCKGCTHCIRTCPTEAIRVRDGKAHIMEERCIDCGECIRTCPHHAKYAVSDSLDELKKYKFNIAVPAPSIAGQFPESAGYGRILGGLVEIGFDLVMEVAVGAEIVADYIEKYIKEHKSPRPFISSACPAVVRLIQVKFPSLLDHIIPVITPMDTIAIQARRYATHDLGYKEDEVGVFFITPCPAKVTAVKQPVGEEKSPVSGAIAISDVYEKLIGHIKDVESRVDLIIAGSRGLLWGREGGENRSIRGDIRKMAVDGIHNVSAVFEKIEDGELDEFDYIEAQACPGGCVGGIFNIENPFVAKERMEEMVKYFDEDMKKEKMIIYINDDDMKIKEKLEPRPIVLDDDIEIAMEKMDTLKEIENQLPGIDCGACGSPTCRAFAEDIVQGKARMDDCIVIMREKIRKLQSEGKCEY